MNQPTMTAKRKCHQCGKKRRLEIANNMCASCNGRVRVGDESPTALRGQWVLNPVTRVMDYVEDLEVAS